MRTDEHDDPSKASDALPPVFSDLAKGLVRGNVDSVSAYLDTVGTPLSLPDTKATVRTHFIRRDPTGRPRVEALAKKLAVQAVEYCIPRSRIKEAQAYSEKYNSLEQFMRLAAQARELFTSIENSGEGGELLLYFLLEYYMGIPQLLCKMTLKTSTSMHVHGTDGVHASLLPDNTLALYWGEAKLHASVSSAINECFASIAPYLKPGDEADERDIILLRENIDTGDAELTEFLVRYFIDDSPEAAKVEIRGACLIGFDWAEYPSPFDADGSAITAEVVAAMRRWHDKIKQRIGDHTLDAINIEIFCIPFPSVEIFRKEIRKQLGR